MAAPRNNNGLSLLGAVLLGGVSGYALGYTGPILDGSAINPVSSGFGAVLIISGTVAATKIFKIAADISEFIAAKTPTGIKGKAKWAVCVKDLGNDAILKGYGPFWGTFEKKRFLTGRKLEPVFSPVESNALICGTAGSGKNTTKMTPDILSIDASMGINDLKLELAATLQKALEEKGFDVHVLNYGAKFIDRLGRSESHNGLNLIADCFVEPGRTLEVANISKSMSFQHLPEPAEGGKGDDKFFRNGGRDKLEFSYIFVVITKGMAGNLADVNHLVSDREKLLEEAQWVSGRLARVDGSYSQLPFEDLEWSKLHPPEMVEAFIEYFVDLASKVTSTLGNSESKAGESFLSEAQQAVLNRSGFAGGSNS